MWAETVTKTISDVVSENSYTVSSGSTINTKCTSIDLDANINVSVAVKTGATGNTGTFWGTSSIDWRLYQGDEPTITVSAADGYTIFTVKFTYSNSNTGVINTSGHGQSIASTSQITSGTAYNVNAASATYYVGNTSTKTNGQVRITAIEVVYSSTSGGGSTPTALSAPTNLSSSNVTTTGATLSWDAVSNASSYTVKIGETEHTGVNTNSYSATGLTAGTQYTWTVKAVGDGTNYSTSAYAANANFTTTAAASHKAYFYVNGTLQNEGGTTFAEGASITFPSDPADINNTKFQGWTKTQNYSNSTDAPSDMTKSATMGDADVNYYAVFATASGNGGGTQNASVTISDYATANSWQGSGAVAYKTVTIDDNITASTTGTTNNGKYYSDWRFYQVGNGNIILTAKEGIELKSATFTFTVSNTGTLVYNSKTVTSETPVALTGSTATFTVGNSGTATNGQVKVTKIDVTYTIGTGTTYSDYCTTVGAAKPTPTLSFANATYNATMGETFTAPTLTNEQNVTVTYTSSAEGVATVSASTGAISLVAPGTTTITASFAGNEEYNPASASYELVVAAAPLTTMDEIFAAATTAGSTATDCRVTFNNWVVSGVKNNNAYVTDNAGKGFVVYTSGHGFEVGDILSGTAACKVQLYNGASELTALTSSTEGLTVTKGGVVTPVTNVALASLSGVNTGAVVSYENLQYNGENFTDGVTSLTPYNTFIDLPTLVNGKNYNVTGVYIQYKDTKEIAPRKAEDFELLNVLNKYIVTIETPTNGTLTIKNGETTVNSGDEVEEGTFLAIVCKEVSNDYRFVKWEYKAGEEGWKEQYESPGTLIMPSANVQLSATFERIPTFTVAWSVNGNIVKSETLQVGTEITAPKVDDIYEKKFTGWVVTATVASDETPEYVSPTKVLNDATYYAVFATLNGAGGEKTTLLSEDFSGIEAGNNQTSAGSSSAWDGNDNFTSVSSAYQAGGAVKLGGGKSTGSITTKTLDLSANSGAFTVEFDAKGWTTVEGQIQVTPTGCTPQTSSITAVMNDDFEHVTMNFTGGNVNSTIVFATTEKRAFIDNILVTTGGGATYSDFTTIVSTSEPENEYGEITFVATNGTDYYATFSNDRVVGFEDVIVGDDDESMASVKIYAVNVLDGQLVLTDLYETHNDGTYTYVPKNTGVLLKYHVEDGQMPLTVPFKYADEWDGYLDDISSNNMLRPASAPMTGDCKFYKLAYNNYTNKTGLGFYWGANNGATFAAKAGGAYLAVPSSVSASNMRGFSFDFEGRPTGIESIGNEVVVGEIYNLQGQRINRLQQGVNIVNGRKVIR